MASQNPNSWTNYIYYIALLAFFGLGIWLILWAGSRLNHAPGTRNATPTSISTSTVPPTTDSMQSPVRLDDRSGLSILLLQIIVIIVVAKVLATVFRFIGQPPVMGELLAGIALGPSLLGLLSPEAFAFLFPPNSMTPLELLSQIGVVLFMFIVGMELDLEHLRERVSSVILVSHASIVVPFLLGSALALGLFPALAQAGTAFTPFALFMGVALSITAFPVLARILKDRGLSQSALGTTALACAAVGDVSAWCILVIVIAVVKSSGFGSAAITLFMTFLFILLMLSFVKPQLSALINRRVTDPKYSRLLLAGVLAFTLACAWLTETLGIHALFGAFLAGVVMPSGSGVETFLRDKIEAFSSAALLPLFFVFTGLRTQVTLLNDWWSWMVCAVIIFVAIAGKLGASMLVARWTKMAWRDSFALGALMNTRGLIELVVLNIGYDLGILSDRIFVMLVIMALATTFMTAPLLSLVKFGQHE